MSDPRDADQIAAHYNLGVERDRLAGGPGALELARTQLLLERYLPAPPAVIADVGGGPGRYALWLAERGYRVHLVDAMPLHVEQARAADRPHAALASAEVGDARALRLADACADAVLLMGPLYHLQERADRVQALAEARRVCRPGGVVIAAAISRFASMLDGMRWEFLADPTFAAIAAGDLRAGRRSPRGARLRESENQRRNAQSPPLVSIQIIHSVDSSAAHRCRAHPADVRDPHPH